MEIKKINFPEDQYYKQPQKKTAIVLHHTVSHGKYGVDGAIQTWKTSSFREGTAFIIAEDGTINQVFSPEYWAIHLFRHKAGEPKELYALEKCTIGIELVNAGPLQQISKQLPRPLGEGRGEGEYTWFDGKHVYDGLVYMHPEVWRDTQYYAAYTEAQYDSLNQLLDQLCKDFNIKREVLTSYSTLRTSDFALVNGIYSHHNFRADKSDVSVAFDYSRINGMNLIANLPDLQGVIGETKK